MLLRMLPTDVLTRIDRALRRSPEPIRSWSTGLRLRLLTEVWHRDCEVELTRRGYGTDPRGLA